MGEYPDDSDQPTVVRVPEMGEGARLEVQHNFFGPPMVEVALWVGGNRFNAYAAFGVSSDTARKLAEALTKAAATADEFSVAEGWQKEVA